MLETVILDYPRSRAVFIPHGVDGCADTLPKYYPPGRLILSPILKLSQLLVLSLRLILSPLLILSLTLMLSLRLILSLIVILILSL